MFPYPYLQGFGVKGSKLKFLGRERTYSCLYLLNYLRLGKGRGECLEYKEMKWLGH